MASIYDAASQAGVATTSQPTSTAKGAIEPIDDGIEALKAEGRIDDSIPGPVETLQWDGHYESIP